MLRDNLAGLIEPMLSSARAYPLALCTDRNESSDDRPQDALKIPARQGGIYTLAENVASPFHAEPPHAWLTAWRPQEIRSLSWLSRVGDTIRLRAENAKTRVARNVPRVGELVELMDRQRLQMSPKTSPDFSPEDAPIGDFRRSCK